MDESKVTPSPEIAETYFLPMEKVKDALALFIRTRFREPMRIVDVTPNQNGTGLQLGLVTDPTQTRERAPRITQSRKKVTPLVDQKPTSDPEKLKKVS